MMHLLLLHGALGAAAQFKPLAAAVKPFAEAHSFDFFGHGNTPASDEPFLIESFARQVLDWMDGQKKGRIDFIGYSMGGYVALYIARHHPDRVGRIMTLATKFLWTAEIAEREAGNLDPDVIGKKAPEFGNRLQELHGSQWKPAVKKTGDMIKAIADANPLNSGDYCEIAAPVMVSVGDRDKLVSMDETIDVYRQLPNASLLVYPGTGHPLENFDAEMVAYHARRFFVGG